MNFVVPNKCVPLATGAMAGLVALFIGAIDSADAKVLRASSGASMVLVFKGADELRRFSKLGSASRSETSSLIACQVPEGSQIEVLGSGYRTAFVKVIDGPASGCQGTVPIKVVQDR